MEPNQVLIIRVSNPCNFKCRMCGEQLSSWEAEKRKHDPALTETFMVPKIKR